mgnify:CR=1 FL=1
MASKAKSEKDDAPLIDLKEDDIFKESFIVLFINEIKL